MDARSIKEIIEELNEKDLIELGNFIKGDFLNSTYQFFTNSQIMKLQQFADDLVKNANKLIKNEQTKRETIKSIILVLKEIQSPPTDPHNIAAIQNVLQKLGSRYQSLFDPIQQNQLLQSSVNKASVPPGPDLLFINPIEFEKAAIYAHQHFLSTPFTCPNPYRPYERAICLLADNRIEDVSVTPGCINKDGSVNLEGVQQAYGSRVQKVVYRPNHELLHSLRQAAMVPKIKEYYDRNTPGKYAYMQPKHLERLQLMMLFSVAGRKDETGFHDSPEAREKFYLKYRSDSATAFLEYAKSYPGLYGPDEEEQLYHDALMVELMGAPSIPPHEDIEKGNYEIVKRIKERNFSLPDRLAQFPGVYLEFMNTAHSLDLLRVYPPDSNDAANNKKNIEKFIGETLRYLKKENGLNEDNIRNCIKDTISMLQFSRKILDESGEKTTTRVELDNKKIEKILSDPLLAKEIMYVIENPNKLDDAKRSISQFLTDRILRAGNYDYTIKRFNYCHYKVNSNLDKDRDFQREVTSSMSMLNAVERPKFLAGEKITAQPVPPITTMDTAVVLTTIPQSNATISVPLGSSQNEKMIKNIIKRSIEKCNITQAGQWETLINSTSLFIEVGISKHSQNQAIVMRDWENNNYQIELKDDELIILDKNNGYAVVTDQTLRATIFNQILTKIPDQYKLETAKISAISVPSVPKKTTTVTTAPASNVTFADTTEKVTPLDYDTYVKRMQDLINDPNFLKGKAVHVKTGLLGDFLLKNARPSIIDKIRVLLDENKGKDSQLIFSKIQDEVMRILTKTLADKKTHNSNPETIKFMKAATNIDLFKKYCEGDYQNQKKSTLGM